MGRWQASFLCMSCMLRRLINCLGVFRVCPCLGGCFLFRHGLSGIEDLLVKSVKHLLALHLYALHLGNWLLFILRFSRGFLGILFQFTELHTDFTSNQGEALSDGGIHSRPHIGSDLGESGGHPPLKATDHSAHALVYSLHDHLMGLLRKLSREPFQVKGQGCEKLFLDALNVSLRQVAPWTPGGTKHAGPLGLQGLKGNLLLDLSAKISWICSLIREDLLIIHKGVVEPLLNRRELL